MTKRKLHEEYPWNKWFKRKKFELNNPKDYQCQTHSMAQQIRSAAYARDKRVSIQIRGTLLIVNVMER